MERFDFLQERERFIPFRLPLILNRILADERLSDDERTGMRDLFEIIRARFHFEFHELLDELKEAYAPFDPDSDHVGEPELPPEEIERRRKRLFEGFDELLTHGNYVQLTREQLAECLSMQPLVGLMIDVDLSDFEDVRVYYRGVTKKTESRRLLYAPWVKVEHEVDQFRRVAILVQTHDGRIVLKSFKDIVLPDLKIISPCLKLRMPVFARLKIGSTVLGGLLAPLWKFVGALFFAATMTWVFLAVVLFGFIGAFVKGVFSFMSCRTKYMQTLSSSLYFQSLANNESVLTRLIDAAEAEEVKEMFLAYYMLYTRRNEDLDMQELDELVEAWIEEQFGLDVDFEVDDGVRKLEEKELIVERTMPHPETGEPRQVLKVYDIPSSLRRMDEMWDNIFPHNNDSEAAEDRVAENNHPPAIAGTDAPRPRASLTETLSDALTDTLCERPAPQRVDASHELPGPPHEVPAREQDDAAVVDRDQAG